MIDTWRALPAGHVTVGGYAARAYELCPPRSLDTYNAGFRRLVHSFGGLRLAAVTPADLEQLRDSVQVASGHAIVQRARASGRRLRSYDPDAHGHGAAENQVRATRRFFRCAVADRLLARSPAENLLAPRRPSAPERALTAPELADLFHVATHTGDDPVLDRLLVLFLRHTAARREGCLNLTMSALDPTRCAVTLSEKFGSVRELPLAAPLIQELLAFSRSRGARAPSDAVFRYRDGHPATSRRFDTLFNRLDQMTAWSEPLDVGAHWLRHTTLTDIAAVAGFAVARAYAGHAGTAKDPTLRYVSVTFDDLAAAYGRVFHA